MAPPGRLVIATRNAGKLREFGALLGAAGWQVEGLAPSHGALPEETGTTFAENARLKALHVSRLESDPVLADDSGLEVFGLDGRPGVRSARYAGAEATDADRIARLLDELDTTGAPRAARFVCALALAQRGSILAEAEGECRGVIAAAPRGRTGFGYDPIFCIPELGRTFAELSAVEKNARSHRGRAVAALLARLGQRRP